MPLRLKDGITLYFCRHGQTQANVEDRFQGRTKDTPLTAQGQDEAVTLARLLARCEADPSRLRFISSPLLRARRTMEIVRGTLGLDPKAYTLEPRIAEIDLGRWEGLTHAEARALDPESYDRREADKWNVRVPGGESYADVAKRCESWVTDLGADTFAVTHGAFTRVLRGLFEGLTWKEMCGIDERQGVLFRVSGSIVERIEAAA